MQRKLFSIDDVVRLTGFSRASIYRMVAKGGFPPPLENLGARRTLWRNMDVAAWIDGRSVRKVAKELCA